MRYVSLFSGIEAASVAWEQLGWEPVAFAEVDPFCCDLLAKRFPSVPNLGDVSKIDWSEYAGAVDLVVGGSPCQAFSVAGNRRGLLDERSALMLEYIRAVRELRPRWLLWENVPGVLSQDSGLAFGTLLDELAECGYSLAWRILDAQFTGVAQRRRRVFLVGHIGARAGYPAAVLFEPQSLRWDHPSSADKRKALASDAVGGIDRSYTVVTRCGRPGGGKGALVSDDVSLTLSTLNEQTLFAPAQVTCLQNTSIGRNDEAGPGGKGWQDDLSYTLDTTDPHAVAIAEEANPCIGFSAGQSSKAGSIAAQEEVAPTLRAGESGTNQVPSVCYAMQTGHTGANGSNISEDIAPTLDCASPSAVAFAQVDEVDGCLTPWDVQSKRIYSINSASPTLCAAEKRGSQPPAVAFAQNTRDEVRLIGGDGDIAGALAAYPGAKQQTYICIADDNANAAVDENLSGTLKVGGGPADSRIRISGSNRKRMLRPRSGERIVRYIVRRLTPIECERLQGFPDGWTDIRENTSDGPRYKALGNSMAVPVMRWIGERIEKADRLIETMEEEKEERTDGSE